MSTDEILNERKNKREYEFQSQYEQTPLPPSGNRVILTPEQQSALLAFQSFIQGQS